jgi:two-component system LytT family response regulator
VSNGHMDTSSLPIRAVIVESQGSTHLGIRSLLNRYADIDVVGEYRGEREGIEAIRTHSPELVFLDVPRPSPMGLETMASVGARLRPYFIFVTPSDAFRRQTPPIPAVDYLVKPLDESRFDEVLTRARAVLSHARYTALSAVRQPTPPIPHAIERIAVKSRGQLLVLRVREIEWVKAGQDYVELHVGSKYWLLRETIGTLETQLAPSGFVRIHRSTLVNVDRVRELRPLSKGEFMVALLDGTELKLSRNYRKSLQTIAGYGLT